MAQQWTTEKEKYSSKYVRSFIVKGLCKSRVRTSTNSEKELEQTTKCL